MDVEIIAHRGASHTAPENTAAAIELAWQQGADAVEVDCRLTADGQIVAIHDADTSRIAGESLVVAEHTLAELQRLDVGCWKGAAWAEQRLSTLGECLATLPDGRRFLVEVKCGIEINEELTHVLSRCGKPLTRLVVISYDLQVVQQIKRSLPEISVYLVARFRDNPNTQAPTPTAGELIDVARSAGLDGLDLSADGPIDEAFVASVRNAGLELYLWTVDDPAAARRFVELGVQGIATNRPGWLREQL